MSDDAPFLTAAWRYLAMLNYEVDPALLAPLVPPGTELDTWDGRALMSVVGFRFLDTRVLGIGVPGHRDFEEINLRFYVRRPVDGGGWRRGVVFVTEIVPRFLVALTARLLYGEPYVRRRMRHELDGEAAASGRPFGVRYAWKQDGRWHALSGQARGAPAPPTPDSEAHFITEHYWGYRRRVGAATVEYRVEHPAWRVWRLERAGLDGDMATTCGPRYADALGGRPRSAFLAEGSAVTVYRPRVLREDARAEA